MTTVTQVGDLKNSTLTGSPGQENDIYGDAVHMTNSKGGNDTLIGGATATNHLFGDALTMDHSKGGNDALIGGRKWRDQRPLRRHGRLIQQQRRPDQQQGRERYPHR